MKEEESKPERSIKPGTEAWERICAHPDFAALLAEKKRFVIPCCIFFMVYYFSFLIFVGWFPEVMKKPVIGKVNVAYLYAMSQFFMAWGMAWLYMRKAAIFDREITKLFERENL